VYAQLPRREDCSLYLDARRMVAPHCIQRNRSHLGTGVKR